MTRKLRARRIGKALAYRADKELRIDQRCQLRVYRVGLTAYRRLSR